MHDLASEEKCFTIGYLLLMKQLLEIMCKGLQTYKSFVDSFYPITHISVSLFLCYIRARSAFNIKYIYAAVAVHDHILELLFVALSR